MRDLLDWLDHWMDASQVEDLDAQRLRNFLLAHEKQQQDRRGSAKKCGVRKSPCPLCLSSSWVWLIQQVRVSSAGG